MSGCHLIAFYKYSIKRKNQFSKSKKKIKGKEKLKQKE
jgi:hypothetical protein